MQGSPRPRRPKPDASALSRTAFARLRGVSNANYLEMGRTRPFRFSAEIDPKAAETWVAEPGGQPRRGPAPDTVLTRLRSRKIRIENELLDLALAVKRGADRPGGDATRAHGFREASAQGIGSKGSLFGSCELALQ